MNVNLFIVLIMNVLKIDSDIYVSFRDIIINVVEDFIIDYN